MQQPIKNESTKIFKDLLEEYVICNCCSSGRKKMDIDASSQKETDQNKEQKSISDFLLTPCFRGKRGFPIRPNQREERNQEQRHLREIGTSPPVHGNKGRTPHNAFSAEDKKMLNCLLRILL